MYIPLMNRLMSFILLFVLAVIWSASMDAQPEYFGCHSFRHKPPKPDAMNLHQKLLMNESIARSDSFDILHYVIHIDVTNYTGQQIKAATSIRFNPLLPGQSHIRFDLKQLNVDSVTSTIGTHPFSHDGEILRVDFPQPMVPDEVYEVTVYYQGTPYKDPFWGGFYFEGQYIYNLGIGLTTVPPNFGKVWYPCFDSFAERATYEYHVKSAGGRRAICQGTFLGEVQMDGDTLVRSYLFDQPIPTHISAIAVANYNLHEYVHTGAYGDIPVTLAARPAQMNSMISRFTNLGAAIDACEYWFGPQPFDRVGYVLTTAGALEIPTNIAYPQFMTSQTESVNRSLYSHELGHHWWGDCVVMHNHTDMWMKEGPAEYSSHLVTEWLFGRENFVDEVKRNQLYVLREAHSADNGFHPLSGIADEEIYGVHTYNKGAAVIHNLRGYLGDALFRQAMSGVQSNHGWRDFTAEQFRDILETESGVDLDDFFDAWIFEPGFSVFVVDSLQTTPAANGFDVTLFLQQQLRATNQFNRNVPLDLTLIGPNWEREEYLIQGHLEFSTALVNAPFVPVMAVLNGHNRLNQARMDYEWINYPGVPFGSILPYVDFRVYPVNAADSALMRVEHIWAAPDAEHLGPGVFTISSSHYWIVDGIWPDESEYEGRIYYDGSNEAKLDHDLFGVTEADAVVVYRASPADPWTIFPGYSLSAGNLTNGTGNFRLYNLKRGQYAFANGDPLLHLNDATSSSVGFEMYPVPAMDRVTLRGTVDGFEELTVELRDMEGRLCTWERFTAQGTFHHEVDLSGLTSGNYLLSMRDTKDISLLQRVLPLVR